MPLGEVYTDPFVSAIVYVMLLPGVLKNWNAGFKISLCPEHKIRQASLSVFRVVVFLNKLRKSIILLIPPNLT